MKAAKITQAETPKLRYLLQHSVQFYATIDGVIFCTRLPSRWTVRYSQLGCFSLIRLRARRDQLDARATPAAARVTANILPRQPAEII